METIEAIEIHPREKLTCYSSQPRYMNDFFGAMKKEFGTVEFRFNLCGDFNTAVWLPNSGETFSLHGDTFSGKVFLINCTLQLDKALTPKTTIEKTKENILW